MADLREFKVVYTWEGEIEVEATDEDEAMQEVYRLLDGCVDGDPRQLFSGSDDFKVRETR